MKESSSTFNLFYYMRRYYVSVQYKLILETTFGCETSNALINKRLLTNQAFATSEPVCKTKKCFEIIRCSIQADSATIPACDRTVQASRPDGRPKHVANTYVTLLGKERAASPLKATQALSCICLQMQFASENDVLVCLPVLRHSKLRPPMTLDRSNHCQRVLRPKRERTTSVQSAAV